MPVRKVKNGPSGKIITRVHGPKACGEVIAESQLEQRACYLFELDPDVVSYESQPLSLEYRLSGKLHRYTPDFLVVYASGVAALLEVKPLAIANTADFRSFRLAVASAAAKLGYRFEVLTEHDLFGPRIDNAKLLFRYLIPPASESEMSDFVHLVAEKALTLAEARMKCLQLGWPPALPFQAMATRRVEFDWDTLISGRTVLSPPKSGVTK